ncbi:MAG: hypothetical protein CM15mP21_6840 [Hyphomicrobiales bacterium]|nr:MAG: hypothetical protein CM15mP21_6840 [Hyphomicrobiales bacterium]
MVKGAVPGAKGGWVLLRDAVKRPLPADVPLPAALFEEPQAEEPEIVEEAEAETPVEAPVEAEAEAPAEANLQPKLKAIPEHLQKKPTRRTAKRMVSDEGGCNNA